MDGLTVINSYNRKARLEKQFEGIVLKAQCSSGSFETPMAEVGFKTSDKDRINISKGTVGEIYFKTRTVLDRKTLAAALHMAAKFLEME